VTVQSRSNVFNFDLNSAGGKIEKVSESPARIQ
jgi:hypothetical protein